MIIPRHILRPCPRQIMDHRTHPTIIHPVYITYPSLLIDLKIVQLRSHEVRCTRSKSTQRHDETLASTSETKVRPESRALTGWREKAGDGTVVRMDVGEPEVGYGDVVWDVGGREGVAGYEKDVGGFDVAMYDAAVVEV